MSDRLVPENQRRRPPARTTREDVPITAYDGVICDLDGVINRGARAVNGAPEALRAMVARGLRLVYATNNASSEPSEIASQLSALGAPVGADDIVTSAQAGARHLAAELPAATRVLALGGPGVTRAIEDVGLQAVSPAQAQRAEVDAVLQGLGRQLTVADFETAARHLGRGVTWVATNDDTTLPLEWGTAPGNGAYVGLLSDVVGRTPAVVGKPHPALYELATAHLGTRPERTLAVGDRLDTDIAGAAAAGIDSAWVLTGVDPPSALFAAPRMPPPTYVLCSLVELMQSYAAVHRFGPRAVCGDADVRVTASQLEITGSGTATQIVRAGLTLLCDRRSGDEPAPELQRMARRLDEVVDRGRAGSVT